MSMATARRARPAKQATLGQPPASRDHQRPPLLELDRVRAAYGSVEVLHGITFAAPTGKVTAILGPNGAGKSTTLRVIGGLMHATGGRVLVGGRDVTGVPPERRARAGFCLLPEGRAIFPNLTVRENLLMDTFACGHAVADLEALVYERFPQLLDRRNQVAGTLSGGEQQMLALGRALSGDPAILALDELSTGLAPSIVHQLFDVVAALVAQGVTVVLVEQQVDAALRIADHVVAMARGEVRLSGPPAAVHEELWRIYLGGAG